MTHRAVKTLAESAAEPVCGPIYGEGKLDEDAQNRSGLTESQRPAIRFLVESALRKVVHSQENALPRTRDDWTVRLCDALMSESETSHKAVISSLLASGVSTDEVYQTYIPEAARYLGELWVADRASFVD
ncbi:MAG: hypothetical protein AAFR27_12825, partial [Pseudomonadota bacterium]